MTLDDALYLVEDSNAAECKVHFKQLGTALAIQRGVYATSGDHRAKGGSPDQWPDELNIREWPEILPAPVDHISGLIPNYDSEQRQHFDSAG